MTSFVLFAVFKGTRLTGWLQSGCKHCRCRTLSTVQIGISTILPYSSVGVSVLWQNVRKHQKVWFLVELLAVAIAAQNIKHNYHTYSLMAVCLGTQLITTFMSDLSVWIFSMPLVELLTANWPIVWCNCLAPAAGRCLCPHLVALMFTTLHLLALKAGRFSSGGMCFHVTNKRENQKTHLSCLHVTFVKEPYT